MDSEGSYRGCLSSNPYNLDSISNPYGRYGEGHGDESDAGAGNADDNALRLSRPMSSLSLWMGVKQVRGSQSAAIGSRRPGR
jgi:hypothetical protein